MSEQRPSNPLLFQLRRVARANGYYDHIAPFDAEIERLAGECTNWKQLHDADEACIADLHRQLREAKERRAAPEPQAAPLSESGTPLTDAAIWHAEEDSMPKIPVVDADFARRQERQITRLQTFLRQKSEQILRLQDAIQSYQAGSSERASSPPAVSPKLTALIEAATVWAYCPIDGSYRDGPSMEDTCESLLHAVRDYYDYPPIESRSFPNHWNVEEMRSELADRLTRMRAASTKSVSMEGQPMGDPHPCDELERLEFAPPADGFPCQQMEASTATLTHQEIFSAVHQWASEIVRVTAAVPTQCTGPETGDGNAAS